MTKKVLYVVTKSNFGGAQRYVYDLATHLSDSFEPVVAFGPPPDGGEGRLAKMLREKSIRTILISELARDISLSHDYEAFRALVRLFKEEKPDVVHLNSSKASGLGALAARVAKVPTIIFTVHGWPFNDAVTPLNRLVRKFFSWLTAIFATHVITISQNDLEQGKKLPFLPRKLRLIYNGIESPAFFSKQEARKALRAIDPTIPEHGHLIGFAGELHPNKNIETVINAIALQSEDMHLVLIGDGELRQKLESHAQGKGCGSRVHFLGYIPEASRYLRAFDIFVLSSLKEGLPYVLLEAGHAYVPVVASNISGIRDIILPDFTGILAEPNDPVSFSNAFSRILHDATLARSLSEELLTRMQKTFAFEKMVEKTASFYAPESKSV